MTAPKNPKPLGFPLSISTEQAISNIMKSHEIDLARQAKRNASRGIANELVPAETLPFGPAAANRGAKGTNADASFGSFKASYMVGDTTPSKVDLTKQDIPGPMILEVTEIDCYDHNPRLFGNEKRDDIRNSIVANGFQDALVVTRRRVGDRFMLASGSNTTLVVLRSLYEETGDEKYRWISCMFQPWQGETRVLAQHLGENLNRGDMKFWEVAKGMTDLLGMIEAERSASDPNAKPLGVRDQAEELTKRGLRADKTSLSRWIFAVERLGMLGPATFAMTGIAVTDHLQPRLNALKGLALKFRLAEVTFWLEVVNPTLAVYGREYDSASTQTNIDAAALCDRIEGAFADHVEETVATIRQMLSTLKLSPDLTLADLRQPSPNVLFAASGPKAQTVPATATQASLPIGPGIVRSGSTPGGNPDSEPANSTATANAPATNSVPVLGASAYSTPAAPLFAAPEACNDPLQALHTAIKTLLLTAELDDTFRVVDDMPLGFFLELPDRERHMRRKVAIGSPEDAQRTIKTTVWWTLAILSGQLSEGCVPYIDKSSNYYKHYSVPHSEGGMTGTDVENQAPEADELLVVRVKPGRCRKAMQELRLVEEHCARVYESLPERWRRCLQIGRSL